MKKLLLSLAMVAAGAAAYAQKPAAGDMTLESQFSLNMGGPNGFTTPEIRYRYFLADDMAFRGRLLINMSNSTDKIDNGSTTNKETGEIKKSQFGFTLGLGIEKHLAGTEKLSPYFGGELFLSSQGANNTDATGTSNGTTFTNKDDKYKTDGGGTFGFGLKAVFGADYYFTNSIYIGGEMGWGLGLSSTSERTAEVTTGGNTNKNVINNESSSFDLSMMNFPTAAVRFGVKF